MTRSVRRLLLPVAFLALGAGGLVTPASAATVHRAAVIVDTGSTVHQVVITFTEDSISGISALQRAGANPAILNYNGQGGAVCALYGVGHPATNASCLGDGSDPRYWAYFRAGPNGPFVYARGGAGTAQVQDGDVEGWKFETGSTPPPFATVDQIAPPPPPPAPPPSAPHSGSPGAPAAIGVGAAAGASGGQGATAGSGQPTLTPSAGVPGATAAGASALSKRAGNAIAKGALPVTGGTSRKSGSDAKHAKTNDALQASSHVKNSSSGGPPGSLWILVALLVVIAGAVVVVRRRRAVPEGSLPGAGP
jgi:MYXO-CTERM domain-containing protein